MTDPAITAALAIPALGSNPHPTKGTPPMNLNNITLTAEIPLDANLDNRTTIGYDSDGDPIYPSGPVTVADAVIGAAAESLAAGLMREFSNRQGGYRSGVSDLYDEKLKERVESIIDAKVEEHFAAMLCGRRRLHSPRPSPPRHWTSTSASACRRGSIRRRATTTHVIGRAAWSKHSRSFWIAS